MSNVATHGPPGGYEPCVECGTPMDPQQRYCVNCAARRGNGANPSSRYFAQVNRKAKRPLTVAKKEKTSPGSRAAAVGFFALLPIAVALGVVVGRGDSSGGGDSEALLQALRAQQATAATTATTAPTAASTGKAKKQGKKETKAEEKKGEGKVTQTDHGNVHELTNYKASKEKVKETTKLVEENPEQVGGDYIKAQQNLPDIIPVGGDGGAAPTNGAEP